MAANGPISKLAVGRPGQALSGRRGSLLVAAVAAIAAVALIYFYVSHHDSTPAAPVAAAPTKATVFVATRYIPSGTPASVIASESLMKRETVSSNQEIAGAIYDPSQVKGQATTQSIAVGQQVTAAAFSPAAKVSIPSYLSGTNRGVAFAVNSYQGLTAGLRAGDHVDVMLLKKKAAQTELLATNVRVLQNLGGNVILQLSDKQALLLTAATNLGTLWFDYRPVHGAKQTVKPGQQEAL